MKITSREMQKVAGLIDQVVGDLDLRATNAEMRNAVRTEALSVLEELASKDTQGARRLKQSLERLVALMETVVDASATPVHAAERNLFSLKTLARAFAALTGSALLALPMSAAAADVGSQIYHPISRVQLTVIETTTMGVMAIDSAGQVYFIFNMPAVGSSIPDPRLPVDANGNPTGQTTILGYLLSDGTRVTSYELNAQGVPVYRDAGVAERTVTEIIFGTAASGTPGEAGYVAEVSDTLYVVQSVAEGLEKPAAPDATTVVGSGSGRISVILRGSNGKNGRLGLFFVPATAGKSGSPGPAINDTRTITGDITAANGPGIIFASIGGDGGDGGDSAANLAGGGKSGGSGGSGGNVTVVLNGNGKVTTTGTEAHGIVVQSRAGVGGEGGSSWGTTGGGGNGGSANSGGTVSLTTSLDVDTRGSRAHGILAQSLGGGAGSSGSSYGLFGSGGDAGWGGNGGNVSVVTSGDILTRGLMSYGILAQSIGGQGGDSGNVGGLAALGGHAGSGGNGANVNVNAAGGSISTFGTGSHGIVAQSIGGGGGTGGNAGGLVAIGAEGGYGGRGGEVRVRNNALLTTTGIGAYGILAQSIGGGGGTAGKTGGLVALGVGGNIGGAAGNVYVDVASGGSIETFGIGAAGIVAQSIGGGGGDGSNSGGLVALGGKGGVAGNSGLVNVTNAGSIRTQGNGADAIVAQSIAGGGGRGGGSGGFVSVGGSGSAGGTAQSATVGNSGFIQTYGDLSRGMLVQSIGGGGGAAGSSGGVFASTGSGGSGGDSVARIGGNSSVKSNGAAATGSNSGTIITGGNLSTGMLVQSIGGGGGDGANVGGFFMALGGNGGAGGDGGSVLVTNTGSVITTGKDASGILAQSIGGGGGNGGNSVAGGVLAAVAIGGSGGSGGKGGNVSINMATSAGAPSQVTTSGDRSFGVLAQSIGGGGGNGGFAISTAISPGASVAVALGGSGSVGGNGGRVDYTGYSNISTGTLSAENVRGGDNSSGLVLQSIGGGGGNGGFSIANSVTGGIGAAVSVGIGGNGAAGGSGGDIIATNAGGNIMTRGDFASGMIAQSIGGGGGNGGYTIGNSVMGGLGAAVTAGIGGTGGAGGQGGTVNIRYTGDITTLGLGSTAILLQSISGGGGNGGFNIGTSVGGVAAPAITVGIGGKGGQAYAGGSVLGTITGDVITTGALASGFIAQSIGGGGGNGGYNVSGAVSGGIGGLSVAVGLGGNAGGGGDGGTVNVKLNGGIYTEGNISTGFLAQSVGGGGGNGGFNVSGAVAGGLGAGAVTVGFGGTGGNGGNGGLVTANVSELIHTKGIFSNGFVAQSVGGGGGNGGFNVSGSIAGGLGAGAINVGLGGSGANGGFGNNVVATSGAILTEGMGSTGFLAQSIGGSGGSGGFNVSAGIAGGLGAGTINVGLGGNGGGGGNGGYVTGNINGLVETRGDLATAIIVQSLGGGGGNGGFNVSGGIAGGLGGGAVGVGLGGNGSGGGNGGTVRLTKLGDILTNGLSSKGIVLQSVGGGGGDGGFNVTGGIAGGLGSGSVGVGLGGDGAGGGTGGEVFGDVTGNIQTEGNMATAVLAQSIGGGGGSGGFNVTGGIAGGLGSGAISVGLGGNGAGGGMASTVTFDMIGNTSTTGDMAAGIVLQSIGGGGGDGGFNVSGSIGGGLGTGAINVSLGGGAGIGGIGGLIIGDITGTVVTAGDMSAGITAQSIGGGGGNGGFSVAGGIAGSAYGSGTINVGLGGSGGGGGSASAVTLDFAFQRIIEDIEMAILTGGDYSSGLIAQSIGGGGGAGAFNVSGGIAASGYGAGTINVGIGGNGGEGGEGGNVTVTGDGAVVTLGDGSTGIITQSIGGGGGSGGFNVVGGVAASGQGAGSAGVALGGSGEKGGNAGHVLLTHTGGAVKDGYDLAVSTTGNDATGILAQSVGGGGGSGGFNVNGNVGAAGQGAGAVGVGLGGSGAEGGLGRTVTANVTGLVRTSGDNSRGVVAQSIGGGGGDGGFNVAGNVGAAGKGAGAVTVGIGGFGAGGGDAGAVVLNSVGGENAAGERFAAYTEGNNSTAFIAQSIGGGGGAGGFNVSGSVSGAGKGAGNITVGLGGSAGAGGNAGTVNANVEGLISTKGDFSGGVLAQSVGGGGGAGGMNVSAGISGSGEGTGNLVVGIGGAGGAGGWASAVSGIVRSNIYTQGDSSFGLTYQSIGGGGGAGGMNVSGGASASKTAAGNIVFGLGGFGGDGGDAGLVSLDHVGTISTMGDYAYGVLAQSAGGGGGSGGMNISGGISAAQDQSGNVVVGIGGFGGGGGDANNVLGQIEGNVYTAGDNAFGTLLQSLGGGGGAGGMNISAGVSVSLKGNSGNLVFGMGGFGGDGGDGKDVTGTVTGNYLTKGLNAYGIGAQSIGGGGGSGGMNVTGTISVAKETSGSIGIGVGGFGGGGGDAGDVDLTRIGDTQTDGAGSDGILAQSIGGGGGSGGMNVTGSIGLTMQGNSVSASLGLGGFGGDGGDAGNVSASVEGNVWAKGLGSDTIVPEFIEDDKWRYTRNRTNGSNGVLAQSVGGGGGSGGMNVSGSISLAKKDGATGRGLVLGLGGFGGGGGDAGTVNLDIGLTAKNLQIQASGDYASAVTAQSIGGGGGSGGMNVSGGISTEGSITLGVGGFGGDGGNGGNVTSQVFADLYAGGNLARGLMIQSIGGGGGAGGINISGAIQPISNSKEPTLVFGLGGFGGAGGYSGDVSSFYSGNILVDGVDAIGALVQSIAGGGGSGGLNVAAALSNADKKSFVISAGIGGNGGDGDDAGDVYFGSTGNILVGGTLVQDGDSVKFNSLAEHSNGGGGGIVAQSIGGGGGTGGINVAGAASVKGSPIVFGMGGSGGSGGHGGAVDVERGYAMVDGERTATNGFIMTAGNGTVGMLAQSIGGGGGNAGYNLVLGLKPSGEGKEGSEVGAMIAVGGAGAGAGSGDAVSVDHYGTIYTQGNQSSGLVAQSIGGGGGNATFNIGLALFKDANAALNVAIGGGTGAAGSGDTVDVKHEGDIFTEGNEARGIFAQSIGGGGGNVGTDFVLGILANSSMSITLGRRGGEGGEGGDVSVDAKGRISTQGELADGIYAQSIGGGGGTSGVFAVSASTKNAQEESVGGSISIGLEGGEGATSGDVDVKFDGELYTTGADARGINAQSIGGGGGLGGGASATLFLAGSSGNMAIGGTGGVGATSGNVSVDNLGLIRTMGDGSDGILAQAIGGGGGIGGSTRVIGVQVSGSKGNAQNTATMAIGGIGGEGAEAGDVDVFNGGRIATDGLNANGIRAQSVGGGGGIGGAVYAITAQGLADNNAIEINIGGFGGTGASGGLVEVENTGLIYTKGDNASGINANSIGGGGGDAGTVLSLTLNAAVGNTSQRAVTSIGGSGGTGGTGGNVVVKNTAVDGEEYSGTIVTEGKASHGIFAQSIGGGGGNGSSVVGVQVSLANPQSVIAGLSVGGAGGSGNVAGTVDVTNTGIIQTAGDDAHGILAQSIGGGGGNGGMALTGNLVLNLNGKAPVASIGGFGGSGSDGNTVTVNNSGSILTTGKRAHGIVAQSIGGGGGNANLGFAVGTNVAAAIASNAMSLALGNFGGGSGGIGGEVVVNHSGDITVTGEGSVAIKAESINGGGGTLVVDISGLVGLPGMPFVDKLGITVPSEPVVVARLGALGATSMNAGKVTVNTTGTVHTSGGRSVNDFVQSISGGGGTLDFSAVLADISAVSGAMATGFDITLGGENGVDNAASDILSEHEGEMISAGDLSTGILTQAIGGGGGRGIVNLTTQDGASIGEGAVTLGATSTSGERGGAINRTQNGAVVTGGDFSIAAVMQSIGGGGGSAVVNLDGENLGADLHLGANGGAGAHGNSITAAFSGGVQSFGDRAMGLVLQSIGAGGGEIRLRGANASQITLGGSAGVDGDGGNIDLNNEGGIYTAGTMSHALLLQSIGGGGGAVFGTSAADSLTLLSANSGNGGAISFTQNGDILASGADSFGIIAQSLGGGGGWVDGLFAGSAGGQGAGGAINLDVDGFVYVTGENSTAVFAQSEGADGTGNITLNLAETVRGGSGTGTGINVLGGADNLITTHTALSSVSTWAMRATTGNDSVVNNGMVAGNIDLGSGANRFLNGVDASFLAFNTIKLREATLSGSSIRPHVVATAAAPAQAGGEATFTNEGLFRVGLEGPAWPLDLAAGDTFGDLDDVTVARDNIYLGSRVITTVELDGHFVQTETGKSVFDVAFGPYASDRVNVTGDAVVSGEVAVNLLWLENADEVTLFSTGGMGVFEGIHPASTLALDFTLNGDNAGVHLSVDSDFGLSFMRPNERRLGGHMDSALQTGGANGIGRLMAALGNMVSGQEDLYQAIFTDLNPEGHVASMQTQYAGASRFADQMFGCGITRDTAIDRCLWGVGSTSVVDQEETGEYWGVTSRVFNARVGMEQRLNANWSFALSAGYNSLNRQTVDRGRMNTQGDGFDIGAGLKRHWASGADLQMTASAGWQWLESQRYGYVFEAMAGHSKGENGYAQLGAEAGYTVNSGPFFLRPALNVTATALRNGSYEETGWKGLGARVVSDTQYILSAEPKITTGWNFQPSEGVKGALSLNAGRVHRSEDGIYLPIQLIGSSEQSDPALITTPLDRSAWTLGLEAKIDTDAGVHFKAGYDAQLGDKVEIHTGSLSVRWTF